MTSFYGLCSVMGLRWSDVSYAFHTFRAVSFELLRIEIRSRICVHMVWCPSTHINSEFSRRSPCLFCVHPINEGVILDTSSNVRVLPNLMKSQCHHVSLLHIIVASYEGATNEEKEPTGLPLFELTSTKMFTDFHDLLSDTVEDLISI